MDRPTAAEFRANTRFAPFLLASGFPDPSPDPDTALEEEIALAWAYIGKRTCRDLSAIDENDPAQEADVLIVKRAVLLRLIQQFIQEGVDYSSTQLDDAIKSFSVPGYSETRGDTPKSMQEAWRLNSLPALHDLLRLLITDECWEKHKEDMLNKDQPFSQSVEVDWFSFPYSNPG